MGNLNLVTGYKGQDHVTAADHGSLYAGIFGGDSYVLNRGNKFAATVVSSNLITVEDGDLVLQGRHIRLNEGGTVDLTIENGSQGMKRNDLIAARYTRDAATGIEDASLVVIKGTAVSSSPSDPEYYTGDIINDHAETVDFPLYRVPLDGLTIGTPEQMFTVAQTLENATPKLLGISNGGTGATTAEEARKNLGVIAENLTGTLSISNGGTGATTAEEARENLGVIAENLTGTLSISNGGTGATTAEEARENLGIGSTQTIQTFNGQNNLDVYGGVYRKTYHNGVFLHEVWEYHYQESGVLQFGSFVPANAAIVSISAYVRDAYEDDVAVSVWYESSVGYRFTSNFSSRGDKTAAVCVYIVATST